MCKIRVVDVEVAFNMKIALVHDFLIKLGGAEKVLQVLHKIYPDAPIYTLLYDKEGTCGIFEKSGYKIITSSLQKKPAFIRKRLKLLLTKFPQAIEGFNFDKYDIVISNSNSYAHGVITKPETLHICYCYSPTRYLWDWHSEYLAENNINDGLIGLYIKSKLSQIRIWDFLSSDRVDVFIAQSKTIEDRIKKYFRRNSTVIYPPTDISKIKLNDNKPKNFYLIVSRLTPYKKIDLAIEAFNQNGKTLYIVGEGSDKARLDKMAKPNIKFLGFLSDQTVARLMGECKALIFPGEEDFGLTPIETMASGRPVIAYKKGGLTETLIEDKTGLFFDQNNAKSLTDAIKRFESNIDNFKSEICREQADKFSEKVFTEKIKKEVLKQYVEHRKKYQI